MIHKKVFILGGGFSKNAKICTQNEFMKFFTRTVDSYQNDQEKQIDEEITYHICKFLKEVFYWNEGDALPSLEDIFTYIDISANAGHNLGKNYRSADLRAIRRFLIYKLFLILDMQFERSDAIDDFIRSSFKNNDDYINNSFISLNWDIVLERQLNYIDDIQINYNVDGQKVILKNDKLELDNIMDHSEKRVSIVKVHGSSNWVYCDNCKKIFYTVDDKIAKSIYSGIYVADIKMLDEKFSKEKDFEATIRDHNNMKKCPFCDCSTRSHIATFSFRKSFDTYAFINSWYTAENLLSDADEWVFIGYSMPDADYEFKHMLKCAQTRTSGTKKIIAVVKDDHTVEKKFNSILGKNNVQCFTGGLEEYNEYLKEKRNNF